jgi:hypothetical protein
MPGSRTWLEKRKTFRKLRYLSYRGTVLHKRPRSIRRKIRRKGWRTGRLIRYSLYRIFTRKRFSPATVSIFQEPADRPIYSLTAEVPMERRRTPVGHKVRVLLRYSRYLLSTGKLFRRKRVKARPHKKQKKFRQSIRITRYLYRKGSLFRFSRHLLLNWIDRNFGFLLVADNLKIIFNSTMIFLFAYLVVFLVYNFSQAVAALNFNVPTMIGSSNILFLIRSRDWTFESVKMIYSSGTFICFLAGILMMIVYSALIEEKWMARLFIFWIFWHTMTHSLVDVFFGVILTRGFGYVILYFFFNDTMKVILAIVFLVFIFLLGLFTTRYFLFTGNIYYNYILQKNRSIFLLNQFMIPFFVGNVVILFLQMPRVDPYEIILNTSMILFLLPPLIRARSTQDIYFDEDPRKISISWRWAGISLAAIVAFRVIFGIGVRIG